MDSQNYKEILITRLMGRDIFTERVSQSQLRTRCPWCGDSQKNFKTGHLYLRINPDDNLPIVYNCFKCPAQGVLKFDDLELLGIEDDSLKDGIKSLNASADKLDYLNKETKEIYYDYKVPNNFDRRKVDYLEKRLGLSFTDEDLVNMKVITSLKDFLKLNDIHSITCKPNMAKYLESSYIGFLSNNNTHILFRDITDSSEIRWFKYSITEDSIGQRLIYTLSTDIDLYSDEPLIVNMSEGVMDCLSIKYNLAEMMNYNTLNIAICGKYYGNVIKYLIGKGILGDNIIINIFADNDKTEDTSIEYYKKILFKYKFLVKEINIYYNTKSKDCGVPKDQIILQHFKL